MGSFGSSGTLGFRLSFFGVTLSCCGCSPQGQLMVTLMLSTFCCRSTTICGSDILHTGRRGSCHRARWEGAEPCSLEVARRCSPLDEDIPNAASEVAEGTWLWRTPELEEQPPVLPLLLLAGPSACRSVLQLIVHIQPDPAGDEEHGLSRSLCLLAPHPLCTARTRTHGHRCRRPRSGSCHPHRHFQW